MADARRLTAHGLLCVPLGDGAPQMAIGCATRAICDVTIGQKPLQALAVVVMAGRAEAAEPVEAAEPAYCVLDSECPRGKCIDLAAEVIGVW